MNFYRGLFFLAGLLDIMASVLALAAVGEARTYLGWGWGVALVLLAVFAVTVGVQSILVAIKLRSLLIARPGMVFSTLFGNLVLLTPALFVMAMSVSRLILPGAILFFVLCAAHLSQIAEVETERHTRVRPPWLERLQPPGDELSS